MSASDFTIATPSGAISGWQSGGTGLPVLMLHGSGCAKEAFARQFDDPLAERYNLIAIDLPGHGTSDDASDPASDYTLRGFAAAAGAVLEQLEITRAAVYGWSLGGHVAIEMLDSNPAVAAVMLTGAPPVSHGPLGMLRGFHTNWDMLLAGKEKFSPRDVERFAQLCFGEHEPPTLFREQLLRADGRLRPAFLRSMMRGEGADQRYTVEHAGKPVAQINGVDEPFARLSFIDSLDYDWLWDEHCHVIAGAGHSPFWQTPRAFNALFSRFLADVEANRSMRLEPMPLARSA